MTHTTQDTIREINRLVDAGYDQIPDTGWRKEQIIAACDHWLQAWERVKQLATPAMRTDDDFHAAYPALKDPPGNWLSELEMHLHNAGIDDSHYFEERIRFVHEQFDIFPDADADTIVRLRRAEGEALWLLGRQAEAEAVYQALVEQLPDQGWAYIGWADQYNWGQNRPTDYPRAEAILLQAMERPGLDDRRSVIERLVSLYETWGQPEKIPPLEYEYEQLVAAERRRIQAETEEVLRKVKARTAQAKRPSSPGRNDPCWCGSGKKYKQCHMKSDRSS
ncbi:MAG: hypothetical protein Kow0031_12230 [Anaerolineae bacterium]